MGERRLKVKTGEPLSAEVMRKFRERNEKAAFDAAVINTIDHLNELLEKRGELLDYHLHDTTKSIVNAVMEKFVASGWQVVVKPINENWTTVSYTITLD